VFYVMSSRMGQLQIALAGWNLTGLPLVGKAPTYWAAAGFTDDVGLYYFVPLLSRLLNWPLEKSLDLFLGGATLLGVLGAGWFLALAFRTVRARAVTALGLTLLVAQALRVSDLYVLLLFTLAPAAAFIVWAEKTKPRLGWAWMAALPLGILYGYANRVRSQSGMAALLLLGSWLALTDRFPRRAKYAAVALVLAGMAVPRAHFGSMEKARDAFLESHIPGFEAKKIQHPIWHNIYIGLGYLPNPYGLSYSDTVAANRVKAVAPEVAYCSAEYEKVLKRETILFARQHPGFVAETLAAKMARVLWLVFLYANLGLLYLPFVRPPPRLWMPFIPAALFTALPGILVMPEKTYLFGLLSLSVVFGLAMIGYRLEKPGDPFAAWGRRSPAPKTPSRLDRVG